MRFALIASTANRKRKGAVPVRRQSQLKGFAACIRKVRGADEDRVTHLKRLLRKHRLRSGESHFEMSGRRKNCRAQHSMVIQVGKMCNLQIGFPQQNASGPGKIQNDVQATALA